MKLHGLPSASVLPTISAFAAAMPGSLGLHSVGGLGIFARYRQRQ